MAEPCTFVWEHPAGVRELFFLHVHQTASQDDAWTAPIWIEAPSTPGDAEPVAPPGVPDTVLFVGSKNSAV